MTRRRRFLCLLAAFLLPALFPGAARLHAEEAGTVTIENARKTSYYTDEDSGDEIIIFTGGVVVSVRQKSTTTKISADTVHFNRTRNTLYAQGSVVLDRDSSGKTEKMTAESLLLDVDTQEGVFDDGRVVQSGTDTMNVPSGSTMIVSADVFAKDDSGAVAFKRGSLTFCDDENPHWKIKASRIWLLPGNEFAFANALLYVGHIPVMYFPFFYYPKDELVFNPVFGYRQREGYFIQTTTYIIGRKPLPGDDDKSFLSFMRPTTLKKQRLEGLVLRNLDEDDKESYPNTLKLMADYYTNLGGMVGVDGVFRPEGKGIGTLDFKLYVGMSRTVFQTVQDGTTYYTPFSSTGETRYNESDFMGMHLPFRYKADVNLAVSSPFTLRLSLPIYSDPFFNDDFTLDRKETMDWIDLLLSSSEEEDEDDTSSEISAFTWSLSGSYSHAPERTKPYLDRLSLSPSASVVFSAKADTSDLSADEAVVSPSRKFFYPSQVKPFAISTEVSGTIFSYPPASRAPKTATGLPRLNVPPEFAQEETPADGKTADGAQDEAEAAPTEADEDSPGEEAESTDGAQNDTATDEAEADEDSPGETTETAAEASETGAVAAESPALPLLAVKAPAVSDIGGLSYKLSYSLRPDFTTEISYDAPATRSDFEWKNLRSTFFRLRSPANLTSTLGYRNGFASLSNSLDFLPEVQRHPEYKSETGRETALKNDYASQKMDLNNTNSLSFKPFVYSPVLKNTSLSWNTGVKLIRTKFIGTVDEPEWEYDTPEWDDESFSRHTVNLALSAEEGDFYQRLTLATNLPPKVDQYSGTLALGFPYFTTSVSSGIKQASATDEEWVLMPLTHNAELKLFSDKVRLRNSFKYELEDEHPADYTLSLSAFGLSVEYHMLYTNGYEYDESVGWKTTADKEFTPVSLRLRYSSGTKNFTYLGEKVKFSPSLSAEISYDMRRPTNSYLVFTPAISFVINDLLTLTFSSSSRNQVIYRYIQEHTGFEPKIPGETNLLKDLANSFAFGDDKLRESSGFKLKSLNVKLTHELHDWQLASEFKIEPRLVTENGLRRYDFSPYFTLSVLWKPMESIKTTIKDEYGTLYLNP